MVQILDTGPTPGGRVGTALGSGLASLMEQRRASRRAQQEIEDLLAQGLTPREAQLYSTFTEGGKTHLAKEIVDRLQRERGIQRTGIGALQPEQQEIAEVQEDIGITPKERVSREETRYKTNLPLFQEAEKKVQALEAEGGAIQRLQTLNESRKLPTGFQRWNVNLKSGELRIPFLANSETQAFVKTINDFTTKAKDSFGARVTNFELNRFMKRLPTLLNTEEGRRVILRQMEIINQINTLQQQGVLDAVENAGGLRKIDYDQAQRKARKENKPQIDKLKKEYISLDKEGQKKGSAKLKKVEKGTPLSQDIARQILQEMGGDKEKARKRARQLGYEF